MTNEFCKSYLDRIVQYPMNCMNVKDNVTMYTLITMVQILLESFTIINPSTTI